MFRYVVGGFLLVAGAVFLVINSVILYRGASRLAHDYVEQICFGVAAGVVPWAIAVMPALVTDSWRKTVFNLYRPTTGTLTVLVVWAAFIAYNIINGAGAIGFQRADTIAEREHGADTLSTLRTTRQMLTKELGGLPAHRPAGAVMADIEAAKLIKAYINSERCSNPSTKDQRSTCQTIARLEGEFATAQAAERIKARLAETDAEIGRAKPISANAVADPQAEMLSDVTGLKAPTIARWLPALTPIILELGAATFWHFAFVLFGWGLNASPAPATPEPAESEFNPAPLMSPDAINRQPAASLEGLTAQRKLCEWFWSTYCRPVAAGSLSEDDWFEHYAAVCRQSADEPLPLDMFRRIAARHVPTISDVGGQCRYLGVLPRIPEQV